MKKSMSVAVICLVGCLFAGEWYDDDGKRWWTSDDGQTTLQMIYMKTFSGTSWSGTYSSFRDQSDSVSRGITKILVAEKDSSYGSDLNFGFSLGGFHFEKALPRLEGGNKIIGAYGVRSEISDFRWKWWCAATVTLQGSQLWTGPDRTELSATPFVVAPGDTSYSVNYRTELTATSDTVWTLAGDMVVALYTMTNHLENCDVVVKSPALLTLCNHWRGNAIGDVPAVLNARKLTLDGGTGIYFGNVTQVGGKTISLSGLGTSNKGVGSSPIITPFNVAATIELRNNATLTATETTAVSGGVTIAAAEGTVSPVVGTYRFDDDTTVISVAAGATLDLTGATFTGTGKATITGAGRVIIDGDGMSDRLVFDPAATLLVEIASGVAVFEGGDALPAGMTFDTTGTGSLFLISMAGFDPSTRLGGTQAVEGGTGSLYVNDTVRENEALAVGANQELKVYGSGLKASSSVTMTGPATIRFYRTATLAASIVSTGSATFSATGDGVEGTLAGDYVAQSVSDGSANVATASGARLIIGGNWLVSANKGDSFYMWGGDVTITGSVVTRCTIDIRGGHVKACDGGSLVLSNSWSNIKMDSAYTSADSCLEAGTNGLVRIFSGNSYMLLGSSTGYRSRLLVNGGTYYHNSDDFRLNVNGTLEVRDGTFRASRKINCKGTKENSFIILSGGVFDCVGGDYAGTMFDPTSTGECTVRVDGHPTISLPWADVYKDTTAEPAQCHWTCTPGSVLSVQGTESGHVSQFYMHNFEASGLVFDLNTRQVNVTISEVASDPVEIGWRLPGVAGNKVIVSGSTPALRAGYAVPEGQTFDAGNIPTGWYEGFAADPTLWNLTFEEGATFLFPYFGTGAALALGGKLTLPAAADYRIDVRGSRTEVENATIVTAAGGIAGNCTWTCTGGVRRECARLLVDGNSLRLSYDKPGLVILFR